jgi:hypothetical protein
MPVIDRHRYTVGWKFGYPTQKRPSEHPYSVQGEFPPLLKKNGVRHFPAPKSHPSSVGSIEKYVQLILYGMRRHTLLVDRGKYLWDRYLPLVVNSINDRVLKVHGYSPSQLLCGITPRRSGWDITPAQEHIADSLTRLYENDPYFNSLAIEESNVAIRQASIDEARARGLDRLERSHHSIVARQSRKARWTAPKVADLVLMRNIPRDGQRGHKLQARWEGPYLLDGIHPNGRAGRLRDIHSAVLVKVKASGAKERVHLDDVKVFIPRPDSIDIATVNQVALRGWCGTEVRGEGGVLSYNLNTW